MDSIKLESEFTHPSDWCPNPQWWHAENGEASELEVSNFMMSLVMLLQPELCIESGAFTGQTTIAMATGLDLNGHGWLLAFDVNSIRTKEVYKQCKNMPVIVFAEKTHLHDFDDSAKISLAFFDSSIDERIMEFEKLRPCFSPNAISVFHDTAPGHCLIDETDLISRLWAIPDISIINMPTPRGLALVQINR